MRKGKTAREFAELFRGDPEHERLYRESQIRFGLSDRMTAMRKQQKLSQEELAKRVGCRQPFIAKLEGGAYDKCEISTLRTFARAMGFDVSVDAMFYAIDSAFFTGHSSTGSLETAFSVQDDLCDKISGIAVSRWAQVKSGTRQKMKACSRVEERASAA